MQLNLFFNYFKNNIFLNKPKISNNYKNLYFYLNKKNNFIEKSKKNNNVVKHLFLFNSGYYSIYKNINNFYFKNFLKFLNIFSYINNNFIFIDVDIKFLVPFYNYVFGFKNLFQNKNFFFIKKKFLTLNNWKYLYKEFLIKNKINYLVILNYLGFSKFLNFFTKLNLPLISVVPSKMEPVYLDFYFYSNFNNLSIFKILVYNIIVNNYFKNYNFKNYNYKIIFLKKFSNKNILI